ncbi:killer cell lectin-like receptor subfamily B member 1B allele C isoform X2 [Microcaecilia unicolor]|uniref:Killer cell lectin-like receptor subfamily B member 1B allele C isoform X2 n=1 Tax=Microcaecilia unicolor TaxID=1415580 RepID=A0A6P7WR82_9AMPH|nr:killer cell lectin-like receptor subfamily B member 1B allele C isoform X2 [Microcaecilia unicolor]
MEATVASEKEEMQEEGMQRDQYFSSIYPELLVWRTLAKVLGLSQAVLVLMMVLILHLCSQCSQQEGQVQLTPPISVKDTAGSVAERCPSDWFLHRGKCYYFSKEERSWSSSLEDCKRRGSELLVIQDQEERDFIQSKTRDIPHWIGLHIPSPGNNWTWVDGSPFNGKLFSVSGSTEEDRCVSVNNHHYDSDSCTNAARWICQKEAGKA